MCAELFLRCAHPAITIEGKLLVAGTKPHPGNSCGEFFVSEPGNTAVLDSVTSAAGLVP